MTQHSGTDLVSALREVEDKDITTIFQDYSPRIYQLVVMKNQLGAVLAKAIFSQALDAIRSTALKQDFELDCDFEDYLYHVCRILLLQKRNAKKIRDFKRHMVGKHQARNLAAKTVREYITEKKPVLVVNSGDLDQKPVVNQKQ